MRVLAIILMIFLASPNSNAAYPDPQDLLINDYANVIKAEHAQQIRQLLSDLKQNKGVEATVVTINSIMDYPVAATNIEDFATRLFNQWGIGNAETNDGILLLVAVKDRKLRIELGKGYGNVANGTADSIIRENIVPHFKTGDFSLGILIGIQEIAAVIPGKIGAQGEAGVTEEMESSSFLSGLAEIPSWVFVIVGGIFLGIAGVLIIKWRRYRKRICPDCKTKMQRLNELADDEHLDEGQQLEESLYSVDYDVWACRTCDHVKVIPYIRWFSGYSKCPQCKYRSDYITNTHTEPATYYSSGMEYIYRRCKKCDHEHTQRVVLPRLERDTGSYSSSSSSSYSSSSSSSFGGGSSSGGGSSGSW